MAPSSYTYCSHAFLLKLNKITYFSQAFNVILPFVDNITDAVTAYDLGIDGHLWWALFTGGVTLLPAFCAFLSAMLSNWFRWFRGECNWELKEDLWFAFLNLPFMGSVR